MNKFKIPFSIKIPSNVKCFVCTINNVLLLKNNNNIFTTTYYTDIFFQDNTLFLKKNNNLSIKKSNKSSRYLENFRIRLFFLIKDFIKKNSTFFYKKLILNGVGYRFVAIKNNPQILQLLLGYSHSMYIKLPVEINISYINYSNIYLSSTDYAKLNIVSNIIKSTRSPDAYKGKGIIFEYDVLKLKEGKKVQ